MHDNFPAALKRTLKYEGGYSNNPADPGGPTMKGVTLNRYSAFLGRQATVDELKAIPESHLLAIYSSGYWDLCKCDSLPPGLDACVFDWAVNSGPGKAVKALQRLSGATPDGVVGPKTLAAVTAWVRSHGLKNCIALYQNERMEYVESLATFPVFGKGWTRRVNDMEQFAHTLM